MIDEGRAGRAGFTDRLVERLRRGREARATAGDPREVMRDPSRVAALRRMDLLDTPYDEVIDRLTRVAARVSDAPVALFTLLDEERQVCKSCVGLPPAWVAGRDSPLAYSYCQRVVAAGVPLVIEDARVHPLVQGDPATLRGVVAYVGAPLVTSDGHAIGTLCVIDFEPRRWTGEEVETLAELAAALVARMELRTAAREAEETARAALRAQEALQESEARFRTAFDAAPIGMSLQTIDGRWIRVNDALCHILGYTREELLTRSFFDVTHPDDLEVGRLPLERLLDGEISTLTRDKRYIHRDGHAIWIQIHVSLVRDARGEPFHLITQVQDITERRIEEERLRHLSFRDELTELYNRRAFLAMADERIKLARRQERRLVLLFADIDAMKWINDSFGHLEGDRAITITARLLRETFRESDLIARLGGDEFAVLADATVESHPELMVERFYERLDAAHEEEDPALPYPLNVSLGATVVDPADALPISELVERADLRMYEEKARRLST